MSTTLLLTSVISLSAIALLISARARSLALRLGATAAGLIACASPLMAQAHGAAKGSTGGGTHGGGEANLVLPDLSSVEFFGTNGHTLLLVGLGVSLLGVVFGLVIYVQLKNLPVHRAMREISELIYATCKTYLTTQGKFILLLWVFIAVIMIAYFG
ncbi:MAG TPA: hypothetical protein VD968_14260 [Pyrinomonadaceae bacterium]|nr:hypothetical protein [Pyrinomonadaceae bacterium]